MDKEQKILSSRPSILVLGGNGYIGSAVFHHFRRRDYRVSRRDLQLFDTRAWENSKANFWDIDKEFIQSFDIVIHLAGHSSVPWCDADPYGSLNNNCIEFFHLVNKLRDDQKFIYASSGSVYGSSGPYVVRESDPLPEPVKPYDFQKQLIDKFMLQSGKRYFGLRFGTVCGFSWVPRNELIINSMVKNALTQRRVSVEGAKAFRGILGMNDLCRAIEYIVLKDRSPGFYNLASFNAEIGDIGRAVYRIFDCDFSSTIDGGNGYSFCLSTSKFQHEFGFTFLDTVESIAKAAQHNDLTVERQWNTKILPRA